MEIKTKFNIGDEFWIMKDNKAISKKVEKIQAETFKDSKTDKYYPAIEYGVYVFRGGSLDQSYWEYFNESECFASKKELIESL